MLAHHHTGKLRPTHHTSYAALMFLIVAAIILVVGMSWSAMAAVPAVNPQSGSIGLTGTVKGPPPKTAARIIVPASGAVVTAIPVTVSGVCPTGTFVTITKNAAYAGAAACQDDGTFSLLVDLFDGSNALLARVTDALGQYGPDSATVHVSYNAPALATPGGEAGRQMFMTSTTTVVAGNPGDTITRTINLAGGIEPYALTWDWGDGHTDLTSVTGGGPVSASHVYDRAGTYRVVVRSSDNTGNNSYIQFVTVVNGPAASVGATNGGGMGSIPGQLVAVWPVMGLIAILVVAFWLGERREVAKLRGQGWGKIDVAV